MPTERNGKAQALTFALPLEAHSVIQRGFYQPAGAITTLLVQGLNPV